MHQRQMRPGHLASRGKLGWDMDAAQLRQSRFRVQRRFWDGSLATLSLAPLPLESWAQTKLQAKQAIPAQSRPASAQPLRPS